MPWKLGHMYAKIYSVHPRLLMHNTVTSNWAVSCTQEWIGFLNFKMRSPRSKSDHFIRFWAQWPRYPICLLKLKRFIWLTTLSHHTIFEVDIFIHYENHSWPRYHMCGLVDHGDLEDQVTYASIYSVHPRPLMHNHSTFDYIQTRSLGTMVYTKMVLVCDLLTYVDLKIRSHGPKPYRFLWRYHVVSVPRFIKFR